MTRKDYVLIAAALNTAKNEEALAHAPSYNNGWADGVDAAAGVLADALSKDNPRFDRARFLKACGVQS